MRYYEKSHKVIFAELQKQPLKGLDGVILKDVAAFKGGRT